MPKSDSRKIVDKIERYYLFHGPTRYVLEKKISSLIKSVISPGAEVFDLDRFDGKRCDSVEVINVLSTPPAVSPLHVVVLTDVEKLVSKGQTLIESFLSKIPDYSVLAMTSIKPDKRSKLFKRLLSEDKSHSYAYPQLTADQLTALIKEFAKFREKKIAPFVADMMLSIFGDDPYRLENEIEKLSLYVADNPEIEKKDLAFSSGFSHVETAYDLPELVFSGRLKDALVLTRKALASGISEMQIIYIFRNFLFRLNAVCELNDVKKAMSLLRLPFPVAQRLFALAKRTDPKVILKSISLLFRAEYSLKSARFSSDAIIELLVLALYFAVSKKNQIY